MRAPTVVAMQLLEWLWTVAEAATFNLKLPLATSTSTVLILHICIVPKHPTTSYLFCCIPSATVSAVSNFSAPISDMRSAMVGTGKAATGHISIIHILHISNINCPYAKHCTTSYLFICIPSAALSVVGNFSAPISDMRSAMAGAAKAATGHISIYLISTVHMHTQCRSQHGRPFFCSHFRHEICDGGHRAHNSIKDTTS